MKFFRNFFYLEGGRKSTKWSGSCEDLKFIESIPVKQFTSESEEFPIIQSLLLLKLEISPVMLLSIKS